MYYQFIILVALIAVVAADSYKPAYSAPAYAAPAYAPVYVNILNFK